MKKRSLVKAVEILHANNKALREFQKEKYVDSSGTANIDIYLNKDNLFDCYSNPNNPKLNTGIFDYIDDEVKNIPVIYPLNIIAHTNEKLDCKKISEFYWERLAKLDMDLKKNSIVSIILFGLGVLLFLLYFSFIYIWPNQILFSEIFSVAATFLIWESVDFRLIQQNIVKIEYYKAARIALAKIEIKEEE